MFAADNVGVTGDRIFRAGGLTVIPAASSTLKGFAKEDGSALDPEQFELSSGEIAIVIFEKKD